MTYLELAQSLLDTRHPDAIAAFWAGSLARGEGTKTSDIDLVIFYDSLPHAWRDSFFLNGRLCEIFVHDPQSILPFYAKDAERGVPSLMHMISQGISLIDSDAAKALKSDAQRRFSAGPRAWTQLELDKSRYGAGDLLDDLHGAVEITEIRAIGAALFQSAFTHHRRSRGRWGATGKYIVRTLQKEEGVLGAAYLAAFDKLFDTGDINAVAEIVAEIYAPSGGLLTEWYSPAPPHRDISEPGTN